MRTVQIVLELPEELAHQLDPSGANVAGRVMEALVLQLFQQAELSSGRAAQLLNVSKDAFLELLAQRDIPFFSQTIEEVLADADVATAARKRASA